MEEKGHVYNNNKINVLSVPTTSECCFSPTLKCQLVSSPFLLVPCHWRPLTQTDYSRLIVELEGVELQHLDPKFAHT